MAQGAREAMVRAGRDSSVLYVGIDGLPSERRRPGGSVCQPTIGFVHLSHARRLAFGTGAQHSREEALQKENELPAALVTSENATLFYMQGINSSDNTSDWSR